MLFVVFFYHLNLDKFSIEDWCNWELGGDVMESINNCFRHENIPAIVEALESEVNVLPP
jgi:hypothetical protein